MKQVPTWLRIGKSKQEANNNYYLLSAVNSTQLGRYMLRNIES